MKELIVDAVIDNAAGVTEFVDEILENAGCPPKALMQINVAIDEVFSNIAYYAYGEGSGSAAVRVDLLDDPRAVILEFEDSGVPFDPLTREDPDITLSADERKIGGLGIYMVRKFMEEVSYEYRDGKNVLTMKKLI